MIFSTADYGWIRRLGKGLLILESDLKEWWKDALFCTYGWEMSSIWATTTAGETGSRKTRENNRLAVRGIFSCWTTSSGIGKLTNLRTWRWHRDRTSPTWLSFLTFCLKVRKRIGHVNLAMSEPRVEGRYRFLCRLPRPPRPAPRLWLRAASPARPKSRTEGQRSLTKTCKPMICIDLLGFAPHLVEVIVHSSDGLYQMVLLLLSIY